MRPLLHSTARMIDATANRAREGLRTLEDVARFVLEDQALCASIKTLRHELSLGVAALPLPPGLLVASRDTPGDVGVSVTTPSETTRAELEGVATAAAKRAGEALRSLEESAKTLGETGSVFESIRYRLYDLERRLLVRLGARAPQWRLCVLISASLCERPWEEVARLAIEGGADCLQLREKSLEGADLLDRAKRLVALARAGGAHAIINDRADIALLSGADGVHVGQGDLPVRDVRRVLGEGAIVGVSTANPEQAHRAIREGASYCGLGPMFTSTTKPKPELAGIEYARAYLADPVTSRTPHLAISGITPERAAELALVGVRGVAVSSQVCRASQPDEACRAIRRALGD
ncbi:MAG: thiamine phosphate synthase [Phycisphaerales bacterium JB059]